MASGRLPALAKLSVKFEGIWVLLEDVRTRTAPALEAVAGTLTRLHLGVPKPCEFPQCDEVDVGYELGVAVGKLRRLRELSLDLFCDGRAYHAMAQGLAASGGDRPLPLLWKVASFSAVSDNPDLVASLLLPSVRVFIASYHSDSRSALLTACGVRQAGYKHTWTMGYDPLGETQDGRTKTRESLRAIGARFLSVG
jgi:hypothetical protein